MYKIFNKLCHPIILNHFTLKSKKIFNTRSNCDFIQPYFKYNYMNNTLIRTKTLELFKYRYKKVKFFIIIL